MSDPSSVPRESAVAHLLPAQPRATRVLSGMRMIVEATDGDAARARTLGICDLSALGRAGVKGPQAARWLADRGIPVPEAPNRWVALEGGGLVARLARSEFLLEDGPGAQLTAPLRLAAGAGVQGVYPVPRQDLAIAVTGERLDELFAQVCNVDLAAVGASDATVVLTLVAGVSAVILRRDTGSLRGYRLWCDFTAGPYLWETLSEIAGELGGGTVGASAVLAATGVR